MRVGLHNERLDAVNALRIIASYDLVVDGTYNFATRYLVINSKLVDAMLKQVRQGHPIETGGVIAGPESSNRPTRLIPMRNIAKSADFFQFDPQQQQQLQV